MTATTRPRDMVVADTVDRLRHTAPPYVCAGPVRGDCGHTHRTLSGAARCLHNDRASCRTLGGGAYSDRRIVPVHR